LDTPGNGGTYAGKSRAKKETAAARKEGGGKGKKPPTSDVPPKNDRKKRIISSKQIRGEKKRKKDPSLLAKKKKSQSSGEHESPRLGGLGRKKFQRSLTEATPQKRAGGEIKRSKDQEPWGNRGKKSICRPSTHRRNRLKGSFTSGYHHDGRTQKNTKKNLTGGSQTIHFDRGNLRSEAINIGKKKNGALSHSMMSVLAVVGYHWEWAVVGAGKQKNYQRKGS